MTLSYDIARCMAPGDCPLKYKCLRELSPRRPDGPQAVSLFDGGNDCTGFIPVAEGG